MSTLAQSELQPRQFTSPSHYDVYARGGKILIGVFDHQETLSIGSYFVIERSHSGRSARGTHAMRVVPAPQLARTACPEGWPCLDIHHHHCVAIAIKQLAWRAAPDRIRSALG